jgi:hypothetical protein
MRHAADNMRHAADNMRHAADNMRHATDNMRHTACAQSVRCSASRAQSALRYVSHDGSGHRPQ